MEKIIEDKVLKLEKRIVALEGSVQEQHSMDINKLVEELEFYRSNTSHRTE